MSHNLTNRTKTWQKDNWNHNDLLTRIWSSFTSHKWEGMTPFHCAGILMTTISLLLVHSSDSTRLDLTIPGEQYFYLRAINAAERQKWLVALGTAKACLTDNRTKREKGKCVIVKWAVNLRDKCCNKAWLCLISLSRTPREHRSTKDQDVRAQVILWPPPSTSEQNQGWRQRAWWRSRSKGYIF